jgi:hypothetical protein
MAHARRDGLYLLLLGCLTFLLFGLAFEASSSVRMVDFGVLYYPSRCLLQHGDPYKEADVLRVFQAEHADRIWNSPRERAFMTRFGYPPTVFSVTVPIAMLPWQVAHCLWLALTAAGLIFSAFLIWSMSADSAPVLSGALIGFLLANCQAIMVLGNAAGIAVSLCAIAVWSFLRQRYAAAGVLCLALSLVLKPHIAWLVWLYFLLAGETYRKRAWQTLAAAVALGAPALVWVWSIAPDWLREMRANLAWFAGPGGPCDPGPASAGSHGIDMLVNLQAVLSVFRDDARFYQPAAYGTCALLLLAWAYVALRSRPSPENAWIALASVSALSMLPFYHHVHDAKLILLAVPACVLLWRQNKRLGRIAVGVTALAFLCTGDLLWTLALAFIRQMPPPTSWLGGQILTVVQIFPAPLALLLMGIFYLYAFARQVREESAAQGGNLGYNVAEKVLPCLPMPLSGRESTKS